MTRRSHRFDFPTLTLVWVLSSEFLGDVLLLQVQDSLLFLFQPAEASSPERRVLVHQPLNPDLRHIRCVAGSASILLRTLARYAVHIIILKTQR